MNLNLLDDLWAFLGSIDPITLLLVAAGLMVAALLYSATRPLRD